MLETLIGCLIGAVVTWLVSHCYYKKAGDELKSAAQALHEQTQLILTGLEQGGMVELNRDQNSKIIGFKSLTVRAKGFDSAEFGIPVVGHAKA